MKSFSLLHEPKRDFSDLSGPGLKISAECRESASGTGATTCVCEHRCPIYRESSKNLDECLDSNGIICQACLN